MYSVHISGKGTECECTGKGRQGRKVNGACTCRLQFRLSLAKCDAAHEKVPNRRNGVISMVVQRTYQGIKQNKNHSKIPSTFRDIEFLLEKF